MPSVDHQNRRRSPAASVVIPAHDEESVIGRCLDSLLAGAAPGELEVVVVANGCSDRTAEIASAVPGVTVIEVDRASKIAALNAGDQAAKTFPRAYVDADVEVSVASLRAVVDLLDRGDVSCAAPRMEVDLTGRPWFVKCFYRGFAELPYAADDLVGNGMYALSAPGRARFDEWPDITADDLYVRNLFTPAERASTAVGSFLVHPPRTMTGLLSIRERSYRGNAEYARLGYVSSAEPTLDLGRMLGALRRRPIDIAVFIAVNAAAKLRLRLRRREVRWERDDSGRHG